METRTELSQIRGQRGISAAQLARRVGISRQTVYAIEAGDYVPNTTLALQLARVLEVRVEDLFTLEPEPAPPPKPVAVDLIGRAAAWKGQPVQVCQVGKRLAAVSATPQTVLLPMADGIVVEGVKGKRQVRVQLFPGAGQDGKRVLVAGCDPGISLLSQHLARFDDVDMLVAQSSSQQALQWLKQGHVHVAGTHLRDVSSGEYNLPMIKRLFRKGEVQVVTFAIWEQGLVLAAGNPKNIHGIDDLARTNVRIVNREPGAGSRELLDEKLRQAGISASAVRGYTQVAPGHLPAALAVSLKEADCCIATRSAARAFGLSFIPLSTERYDLVIRRQYLRLPAVQALLDVLNRAVIRQKLEVLAGYDTSHTGEVLLT